MKQNVILCILWEQQYIFWISTWLQEESNDNDSSFRVNWCCFGSLWCRSVALTLADLYIVLPLANYLTYYGFMVSVGLLFRSLNPIWPTKIRCLVWKALNPNCEVWSVPAPRTLSLTLSFFWWLWMTWTSWDIYCCLTTRHNHLFKRRYSGRGNTRCPAHIFLS